MWSGLLAMGFAGMTFAAASLVIRNPVYLLGVGVLGVLVAFSLGATGLRGRGTVQQLSIRRGSISLGDQVWPTADLLAASGVRGPGGRTEIVLVDRHGHRHLLVTFRRDAQGTAALLEALQTVARTGRGNADDVPQTLHSLREKDG